MRWGALHSPRLFYIHSPPFSGGRGIKDTSIHRLTTKKAEIPNHTITNNPAGKIDNELFRRILIAALERGRNGNKVSFKNSQRGK